MQISVTIQGVTPVLFDRFIQEDMENKVKADKNALPREVAERSLYKDEKGEIYIPGEMLFSCIIDAGKFHKVGKNKVTTVRSSLIPSYLSILDTKISLNTKDFEVDTRSVVNPMTGGRLIKHRPRLDAWTAQFTVEVDHQNFSEKFVRELIDDAGTKCGIGSYRPNRKGIFGKFKVIEWRKI